MPIYVWELHTKRVSLFLYRFVELHFVVVFVVAVAVLPKNRFFIPNPKRFRTFGMVVCLMLLLLSNAFQCWRRFGRAIEHRPRMSVCVYLNVFFFSFLVSVGVIHFTSGQMVLCAPFYCFILQYFFYYCYESFLVARFHYNIGFRVLCVPHTIKISHAEWSGFWTEEVFFQIFFFSCFSSSFAYLWGLHMWLDIDRVYCFACIFVLCLSIKDWQIWRWLYYNFNKQSRATQRSSIARQYSQDKSVVGNGKMKKRNNKKTNENKSNRNCRLFIGIWCWYWVQC